MRSNFFFTFIFFFSLIFFLFLKLGFEGLQMYRCSFKLHFINEFEHCFVLMDHFSVEVCAFLFAFKSSLYVKDISLLCLIFAQIFLFIFSHIF